MCVATLKFFAKGGLNMHTCYDITIKNKTKSVTVCYWADSFSIDQDRLLKVQSQKCGDVTVRLKPSESLTVKDVLVEDEWDEWDEM